ncbi:MAG: hypothetical protein ABI634_00470 [Acidobacteriota bacterium]
MRSSWRWVIVAAQAVLVIGLTSVPAWAHSGPPFPIVSTQQLGPYEVSVWTDPDTTDDGTPGGRFWITLRPTAPGVALPQDARVVLSVAPADRTGVTLTGSAEVIDRDPNRRYVALLMDHEGRYAVHLTVDSTLGRGELDSVVDATYDLRPAPFMIVVFAMPFVLVGFLWIKLLLRRRRKPA